MLAPSHRSSPTRLCRASGFFTIGGNARRLARPSHPGLGFASWQVHRKPRFSLAPLLLRNLRSTRIKNAPSGSGTDNTTTLRGAMAWKRPLGRQPLMSARLQPCTPTPKPRPVQPRSVLWYCSASSILQIDRSLLLSSNRMRCLLGTRHAAREYAVDTPVSAITGCLSRGRSPIIVSVAAD